ncbi:MAG: ATP-grasp domain-containing protein, partial [Gemmataceae bacterium]|nr:ATP-grasp domain-containing protein [Gemmataceae bacterium]
MHGRSGRVLVVGDNDLAGLASVRSLGRAGLRVSLVSFEDCPAARWSRHVSRVHRLGHPLRDAGFADRVLDLLRREPFDVVLPTSDKGLLPLLPVRREIDALSRLAAPEDAALDAACRKEETVALAQRLGVPVPPTELVTGEGWTPSSFPVVLKPSRSVVPGSTKRNEVAIARTAEEVRRHLPALLRAGPVLAQGFVGGRGVGLNVLADRGEIVAAFQHRRLHEPADGGASSYRASEPLSPALLGHARKLMAALRWTGPAMLEFKDDPDNGPSLMEINGRLWGSVALAIAAGVDFPRLCYDLFVTGRAGPCFGYRAPFHLRHTTKDLFWLRQNFRPGPGALRLSAGQLLGEAWNVLRGREGYDLEWLTDPLPAVAAWGHLLSRAAASAWGRFRRWRLGRRLARNDACSLIRHARSALVVCTGNVNRSAVAACLLADAFPALAVASAGTLGRDEVSS